MTDKRLKVARKMAKQDIRDNKCGFYCRDCGAFWTYTGFGKEWHEPKCPYVRRIKEIK